MIDAAGYNNQIGTSVTKLRGISYWARHEKRADGVCQFRLGKIAPECAAALAAFRSAFS